MRVYLVYVKTTDNFIKGHIQIIQKAHNLQREKERIISVFVHRSVFIINPVILLIVSK